MNPGDAAGRDALDTAIARGNLAARWFLRALARGELPTTDHARRVADLERVTARSPGVLVFTGG